MGQRGLKRTSVGLYNIELSFLGEEGKGWNKANMVPLADPPSSVKPDAERTTPACQRS